MPKKLEEWIENGVLDAGEVLENIFSNYFSSDEADECVDWISKEYSLDEFIDDDDEEEWEEVDDE